MSLIAAILVGNNAGLASAADPAFLNVQGQFTANHRIVVSGTISTGEGKWITLAVNDASEKLFYINQTTSGEDGHFTFDFPRGEDETYSFILNGSGVAAKYAGTISGSTDPTDPVDPDDPPIVYPGNNTGEEVKTPADVWTITSEQLDERIAAADHKRVVIDLPQGKKTAILPAEAMSKLRGYELIFRQGELTALFSGWTEIQQEGSTIVFSAQRMPAADTPSGPDTDLTLAGDSFEINWFVRTGEDEKLDRNEGSLIAEIPYDAKADSAVLGIYRYNDTLKKWEYCGGEALIDRGVLTATLTRPGQYAVMAYEKRFTDMTTAHWAYPAIRSLAAKHIVNGVNASQFAPGKQVTRAEFAALLVRALKLEAQERSPFLDVRAEDWFAKEVAAAYEAGIITGRTGERFAPNEFVTREEMAVMLARAAPQGLSQTAPEIIFKDRDNISKWAIQAVALLSRNQMLAGDSKGNFHPDRSLTRAEAAQAVYHLYNAHMKKNVLD